MIKINLQNACNKSNDGSDGVNVDVDVDVDDEDDKNQEAVSAPGDASDVSGPRH